MIRRKRNTKSRDKSRRTGSDFSVSFQGLEADTTQTDMPLEPGVPNNLIKSLPANNPRYHEQTSVQLVHVSNNR